MCRILVLSIDRFVLIYLKDANFVGKTIISFDFIFYSSDLATMPNSVADNFLFLVSDSKSAIYLSNWTSLIDISNMPIVALKTSAFAPTSKPSSSSAMIIGITIGSVCLFLFILCFALYRNRKSCSEWLLWRLGQFRFQTLSDSKEHIPNSYALSNTITNYPAIGDSADEDDDLEIHDSDSIYYSKYSVGGTDDNDSNSPAVATHFNLNHMKNLKDL